MGLFGVTWVSDVQHLRCPLLRELGLGRSLAWSSTVSAGGVSNIFETADQGFLSMTCSNQRTGQIYNQWQSCMGARGIAGRCPQWFLLKRKNMQRTAQLTLTFSWVGQCPMTLVTLRTSLGCGWTATTSTMSQSGGISIWRWCCRWFNLQRCQEFYLWRQTEKPTFWDIAWLKKWATLTRCGPVTRSETGENIVI